MTAKVRNTSAPVRALIAQTRILQEVVPRLKRAAAWEEELTEEEYQEELAHLRRELPGVIRRLQNSDVPASLGPWRVDRN